MFSTRISEIKIKVSEAAFGGRTPLEIFPMELIGLAHTGQRIFKRFLRRSRRGGGLGPYRCSKSPTECICPHPGALVVAGVVAIPIGEFQSFACACPVKGFSLFLKIIEGPVRHQ